jgi:polyisoprenyl-phosphate glycosyltransferase
MNTNKIADRINLSENVGAKPALSVIVPCFNEEMALSELIRRTTRACRSAVGSCYELILVDDGSLDNTWVGIHEVSKQDRHVVGVKLSRNHGHQLAITAGVSVSRGEVILVIDADLQDPPELLGQMLELMRKEHADVVNARRRSREGETWFKRKSASWFYRFLSRVADVDIPLDTGDFRLMTRRVADLLIEMPERDRFVRGMVAWLGFKQVSFPYDRETRYAGSTKYPLLKMIRFATDAFLGHSMVLLRIAGIMAGGLLLILFALALFTIIAWLVGDTVPGWTSMTMLIILIGACQLLVLSIIGEYVGRIYLEGKRRPLFVIEIIRRSAIANNAGTKAQGGIWQVEHEGEADQNRALISGRSDSRDES